MNHQPNTPLTWLYPQFISEEALHLCAGKSDTGAVALHAALRQQHSWYSDH